MIDWLFETLVWTGVLIALVLFVRRPVARHLGPQAAYALWLIPFARLFLPAIELPAMVAPQVETLPVLAIDPVLLMTLETQPVEPDIGWQWTMLAMAIWLMGAIVMLVARYLAYFRMRTRLLDQADQKLVIGNVRIVETRGTESPLAFGVIDKVIAVPTGFLTGTQTRVRNLAIAHELAHHQRGDLFANFAVQPLFALHWFNPLGWLGWRALRRDQEAACDARVVASADEDIRAVYAQTIARFSAGPDLALAAPMACPVLGEKSIIERLRSLKMTDISPRRRWAGRAALFAGLVTLPLTASFTYATPGLANEPVAQDDEALRQSVVIREIDPDAAPLTEREAEELAERAAAISDEMEDVADEIERKTRLVFVKDGKIVTEEALERQAAEIDRAVDMLEAGGNRDIAVRIDLGEARMVDAGKLARLESLGRDMERLQMRIENDPEWRAGMRKLQDLSLRFAELQMPRLLELQRDLVDDGLLGNCEKNGNAVDCSHIDIRKMQRDALIEARREVERDRELSDGQRARALRALDRALSQD